MEETQNLPICYAIASFTLGLFSIMGGVFIIGMPFAIIGAYLGYMHLRREKIFVGMARWGIGLSMIGLLLSIISIYAVDQLVFSGNDNDNPQEEIQHYQSQPVPDISLVAINGEEIVLKNLRGRRVALVFLATWCPPCLREIPHLQQLVQEIPDEQLTIIGLSEEDPEMLIKFAEKYEISYPIVSQAELPEPFSMVASIPTIFFIDKDGIIDEILSGYHDYETLKQAALGNNIGS